MISSDSLSGRFDLRVYDAYTGRLTKSRSFPNLITNQGLSGYCGASPQFSDARICVGNGTAAPTPEDTTLSSFLAVSPSALGTPFNGGCGNYGAPDYISWTKATARFSAGTFNGTTITEVGVTNTDNSHPVWSRALIVDERGNPSVITVLANEHLDVSYTLFYHPKLTDDAFSFVMNGETYNCVARAAKVADSVFAKTPGSPLLRSAPAMRAVYNSQTLGDVTGEPIYSSGGREQYPGSSAQNLPYATDTPYTHKSTHSLDTSEGNFDGGIGAMLLGSSVYGYNGIASFTQISITPKLPKDANTEMTFTFAKTVARWTAPSP